ncbi:TPA: hypothetical protein ACPO8G_000317 [Haemophilus influenzae]
MRLAEQLVFASLTFAADIDVAELTFGADIQLAADELIRLDLLVFLNMLRVLYVLFRLEFAELYAAVLLLSVEQ